MTMKRCRGTVFEMIEAPKQLELLLIALYSVRHLKKDGADRPIDEGARQLMPEFLESFLASSARSVDSWCSSLGFIWGFYGF